MAVATPLFWIGVTGEFAALAPLSLNALIVHAGAVIFLGLRIADGQQSLWLAATMMGVQGVVALLLLRWSRWIPVRDPRPTPGLVRVAFVAFAAVLLVVGTLLVLQRPQIFPWNLAPATSTMFGLLFLGASTFFAYGVARPRWAFAAGQLWGFLAYDIVLFIPYGRMLSGTADAAGGYGGSAGYEASAVGYSGYGGTADAINMPSLVVYLSVLAASTLLAIWMFAVDKRTSLRHFRRLDG